MKEQLIDAAKQARLHAYTPYSGFKVGAAVLTKDNRIVSGCNVENSSYGLCICGERTALFKAVSEGIKEFVAMAVVADTERPVSPCGACRQVMSELCPGDMPVYLTNLADDVHETTIDELLPYGFKPADLRK